MIRFLLPLLLLTSFAHAKKIMIKEYDDVYVGQYNRIHANLVGDVVYLSLERTQMGWLYGDSGCPTMTSDGCQRWGVTELEVLMSDEIKVPELTSVPLAKSSMIVYQVEGKEIICSTVKKGLFSKKIKDSGNCTVKVSKIISNDQPKLQVYLQIRE